MARGIADIFQVIMLAACAHAFLARCSTGVGAFVEAKKDVLKLVHPRVGEQQGRIVSRHQRT